jgi:hypothetical protein
MTNAAAMLPKRIRGSSGGFGVRNFGSVGTVIVYVLLGRPAALLLTVGTDASFVLGSFLVGRAVGLFLFASLLLDYLVTPVRKL